MEPETKIKPVWIISGIVLVVALWVGISYNSLVTTETDVQTAFANLDGAYQRRMDLANQLVPTVDAVFKQEGRENVFAEIATIRSSYQKAGSESDKLALAGQFDASMGRFMIAFESYPQLQTAPLVRELNSQLEGSENRVAVARERYNASVAIYTSKVRRFPSNIVASLFSFADHKMFEAQPGAQAAPTIKINQ